MKILITNDDGVLAPALPKLIRWAQQYGEVVAVAPKVEQSGKSHAIDFMHPQEIKQVEIAPDLTAWSMDSTPADCVRFALDQLGRDFDLILSGVNRGYNLGADIVYSGTVGAIFEGIRQGIPGIALSGFPTTHIDAIDHLDRVFDFIHANGLLSLNPLYNVNIPPEAGDVRITRQGGIYFTDRFVPIGDDLFIQEGEPLIGDLSDTTIDIAAVHSGLISVTPLSVTRTELAVFERLNRQCN
ncbi:MAG: 5'/3'-nucleotidase SurE [Clostridia bacterium]|nr:5'/3'-nucleotidase SurE [Clostridia bacterium]